jgi:ornithine decarboxylase
VGVVVIPAPVEGSARLIDRGRDLETPYLLIDLVRVRANARRFQAAFPGAELFYAIKANAHPSVLDALAAEGVGFEISSDGELDQVLALGTRAPLISSNPVKAPRFVGRAGRSGVQAFAVDAPDELRKIAREAPGAAVYVRLLVDNRDSEWPLARKYGVGPSEALDLLDQAADLGLRPRGTTFHVGSQCRSSASWRSALEVTAEVWDHGASRGHVLDFLSVGGGMPIQHTRPIPELEEIGAVVRRGVAELFPRDVYLSLEPGRALVGDAAILGASIIGKARRPDGDWIYLDVGVFNGLMEAIDGFSYEIATAPDHPDGPRRNVILAGPSCDSVDVIAESVSMPEVDVGDRVYVLNAGAYTLSYASHFNGWAPPTVQVVDTAT